MALIEGLTALEGPVAGTVTAHRFSLPAGFDSTRFASKWVEDGPEVMEAAQPQILAIANVKADGWAVYKVLDKKATDAQPDLVDDKSAKIPKPPVRVAYTRVVGKKIFVLLFRPKVLQKAVNAIHADTSRILVNQEVRGERATANENGDEGILTNADLQRHGKQFVEDEGASYLPPVSGGQPTRLAHAQELNVQ